MSKEKTYLSVYYIFTILVYVLTCLLRVFCELICYVKLLVNLITKDTNQTGQLIYITCKGGCAVRPVLGIH